MVKVMEHLFEFLKNKIQRIFNIYIYSGALVYELMLFYDFIKDGHIVFVWERWS